MELKIQTTAFPLILRRYCAGCTDYQGVWRALSFSSGERVIAEFSQRPVRIIGRISWRGEGSTPLLGAL